MSRQVYPSPTPSPRLSEPQPKIPELQQPNARKSTWEISWWTLREGGSIRNARLAGIGVVAIMAVLAGAFVTPQVSGAIVLLVVVGGLALFGLQRLLGSEEDSPQ